MATMQEVSVDTHHGRLNKIVVEMETKGSVSYLAAGVPAKVIVASRRSVDCVDVSPAASDPPDPGSGSADSGSESADSGSGSAVAGRPESLEMVVVEEVDE